MLFTILFYFFVVTVFIQLIYYIFLFGKFSFSKHHNSANKNIPVSIIICARNEAENIRNNLESVIKQNYANFEVIVVNDASSDESLSILTSFEKQHPNLKIIDIELTPNYAGNKKNAITQAIVAASHDKLLFTDADCKPVSSNWIHEMTSHFF